MFILGICGSLRRGSYNHALLRAACRELDAGTQFEIYQRLGELPPYSEDLTPTPESVTVLRHAIATADAVLISTPEYNSSLPGVLKNALDWASRPWPFNCLRHKAVAVIGTSSGGYGATWAQMETRRILAAIGAHVIEEELPVPEAETAIGDDGRLRDLSLRTELCHILELLNASA